MIEMDGTASGERTRHCCYILRDLCTIDEARVTECKR